VLAIIGNARPLRGFTQATRLLGTESESFA
jgi:hypothetical protein